MGSTMVYRMESTMVLVMDWKRVLWLGSMLDWRETKLRD